ncbi:hypothetical protein ElyMa_000564000 [Elysia marginata]|uniref:Uncharacterized protein n=1 Tax=Elysia marginata TaxID=1093978 RepID=A0AAV4G414_9GAST|nr:hypothetical protein ElyMa_000564000 [Elysia marginata]
MSSFLSLVRVTEVGFGLPWAEQVKSRLSPLLNSVLSELLVKCKNSSNSSSSTVVVVIVVVVVVVVVVVIVVVVL